jgi:hypothetical protein
MNQPGTRPAHLVGDWKDKPFALEVDVKRNIVTLTVQRSTASQQNGG